jgi:hypothetical protein
MAWRKIDSQRTQGDESLSAFLCNGLATNATCYASELSRSFSVAWPGDTAPKWASYEIPIGFVMMLDVGQGATEVTFDLTFAVNTKVGGSLMVAHQASQSMVQSTVAAGATDITITLTLLSPQDGPQAFFVGWISEQYLDEAESVRIHSAVDSQIEISKDSFDPVGNGGVFFGVIDVPSTALFPGTPNGARTRYQVCRVTEETSRPHPDGYLHVWPAIEENPPWFPTVFENAKYVTGYLYELGWIQLYSITATVSQAVALSMPRINAHDFATSLQTINRLTGAAYVNLRRQIAAAPAQMGGGLHAILSRTAPVVRYFSVQNTRETGLTVNFRAYPLNPGAAGYTFTVEVTGPTGLVSSAAYDRPTLPSLRPQQRATSTSFEAICAIGASIGAAEWGMSDALAISDMLKTIPITLVLPTFTATAGDVYEVALRVDIQYDFHVVGLFIVER